jgi:2-oxoglutarate dehydrogenase E1 component
MLRDFRKPLVMMTPKSLLRHKLAVSKRDDFIGEGHFHRILSDLNPPGAGETRRAVLLARQAQLSSWMEARDAAGDTATEIIRIEQLSPSCPNPRQAAEGDVRAGELVWRRKPKNNGAWQFAEDLLEDCLAEAGHVRLRPRYAGRAASASPATGLAKRHAAEQAALIADALGHSSRSAQSAQAS